MKITFNNCHAVQLPVKYRKCHLMSWFIGLFPSFNLSLCFILVWISTSLAMMRHVLMRILYMCSKINSHPELNGMKLPF